MESVDVDSEMDEILKEAQETNPDGVDTSDTGTPNAKISSSPNLLEPITLLEKALAVHGAGGSGQADTTVILSESDTNTGSTCNEYLSEISQDLEKCEERRPPLNKDIAKLFQNLVYIDINVEKLENLLKKVLPQENINGIEANKVNSEIWRQIAHQTTEGRK